MAHHTLPSRLVERANRTWKENTRAVIMSKVQKCKCTLEISHTTNITYHSAIKTTPYDATFGFKAHRETLPLPIQTIIKLQRIICMKLQSPVQINSVSPKKQSRTKRPSSHENERSEVDSRQQKRKKIEENQAEYNQQMVHQTNKVKQAKFKEGDTVSIKIERVDKKNPLHPNMLFGKILNFSNYATVITHFGRIKRTMHFSKQIVSLYSDKHDFWQSLRNNIYSCLQSCKFAIAQGQFSIQYESLNKPV